MLNSTSVSNPMVSSLTCITSSVFSMKMSLTLAMKCSSILLMMAAERDWLESDEETEEFKNYAISLGLSYLISCLLYLAWTLSVYLFGMRRGLNQSYQLTFLQELANCPSDKCSSNRFSKGIQLRKYLLDLDAERVRCGSAFSVRGGMYFSFKSWDLLILQSLSCTPLALI